jgi:hypothetical protein
LTGFRVPNVVISPWAKPDYVSHLVYDHTSVLKTIETKWNLPALTYRDANAMAMTDYLVPNHGLAVEQAPFHDTAAVRQALPVAPPSSPTGNPDVDSNLCDNNQAQTAAEFPPAVKRPGGAPPGGPSGGTSAASVTGFQLPGTTTPVPIADRVIKVASGSAALIGAGVAAAAAVRNGGRNRTDGSPPGDD